MKIKIEVTQEHIDQAIEGLNHFEATYSTCPIAQALRSLGFYLPFVGDDDCTFSNPGAAGGRLSLSAELPKEAVDFIADFDQNKLVSPISFEIEAN